jgi:ClpP class serine protease
MINELIVNEILLSPLCIEPQYAQALAMSAFLTISQQKALATQQQNPRANSGYVSSYTVNAATGQKQTVPTPGAVGIVVIDGPIVSASDPWYGLKGTLEAAQELQAFESDPNIIGTVLVLESGGGAVYAIKPIADVLSSLSKPIVTYTRQILASAAYRIAANTDYIMMYHPQGVVGSLGTMASFSDMQPMFEKWGMKFSEYYATESILKNKTYNDARQGNGAALIKNVLDPMNATFLGDIKNLRGDKLDAKTPAIYQGETFMASPQAIKLGLIDSLGNLSDAIGMVSALANGSTPSSINSTYQKSNIPMWSFNSKFSALAGLAGVAAAQVTEAQVDAVNKEIVEQKIEGVTLVLDSALQTADEAVTGNASALTGLNAILGKGNEKQTLAEAVTAVAALNSGNTELGNKLTQAEKDRDDWKTKAEAYGDQPGELPTAGTKKDIDKIEQTNNTTVSFYSEADAELDAALGKAPKLPGKK